MSLRLVLIGEGQGEEKALPILVRRLLKEKGLSRELFVDDGLIRVGNAAGLLKFDRNRGETMASGWQRFLKVACRRAYGVGVLAVFDGDARNFPAGTDHAFCASTAAKKLAAAAAEVGAGATFSLAVVFAVKEFESWLIAGADSLWKSSGSNDLPKIRSDVRFPLEGNPEQRGKRWLEAHTDGYRPTRHQHRLAEAVNLSLTRAKNLRSFRRLEHAIEEIADAARSGKFIATPS